VLVLPPGEGAEEFDQGVGGRLHPCRAGVCGEGRASGSQTELPTYAQAASVSRPRSRR
jgi:hypothetical protein